MTVQRRKALGRPLTSPIPLLAACSSREQGRRTDLAGVYAAWVYRERFVTRPLLTRRWPTRGHGTASSCRSIGGARREQRWAILATRGPSPPVTTRLMRPCRPGLLTACISTSTARCRGSRPRRCRSGLSCSRSVPGSSGARAAAVAGAHSRAGAPSPARGPAGTGPLSARLRVVAAVAGRAGGTSPVGPPHAQVT